LITQEKITVLPLFNIIDETGAESAHSLEVVGNVLVAVLRKLQA
jgi:hypothetical protein